MFVAFVLAQTVVFLVRPVSSWASWLQAIRPLPAVKPRRCSVHAVEMVDRSAESELTLAERGARAGALWGWALPTVARYYALLAKLTLDPNAPEPGSSQRDEAWAPLHRRGAAEIKALINDLRGFYVKSGQFVTTRRDLFPDEYCDALEELTDRVEPLEPAVVRKVVEDELGEPLEHIFSFFDMDPLGSASIAQVHRARLRKDGRDVAVKVQRPSVAVTMMDDVANLKALTKLLRDATPVDYFTVMKEIETQVREEFDFTIEEAAMRRIGALWRGGLDVAPMRIPQPCTTMTASPRCLVMDFVEGVPLSQFAESRVTVPSRAEEELFGRLLLRALTDSFGRQIFEEGFFHGDPHPGNIMVSDGGASFSLIDFGQTKQIPDLLKRQLAQAMVLLSEAETWRDVDDPLFPPGAKRGNVTAVAQLVREIGLTYAPGTPDATIAAVGVWLFDATAEALPGGLSKNELSLDSPIAAVQSFPSEIVFVARSTLLIRGVADSLRIPWNLAKEWAPAAAAALAATPDSTGAQAKAQKSIKSRVQRPLVKVAVTLRRIGLSVALAIEKRLPLKAAAFFRRCLSLVLLRVLALRERASSR